MDSLPEASLWLLWLKVKMGWKNCGLYDLNSWVQLLSTLFPWRMRHLASLVRPENIDGTLKEIKENRK